MANPFVHCELMSTDPEKSQTFFSKMFDWKFQEMPSPDGTTYSIIKVGDGTGGGLMKNPIPGVPSMWVPYVLVDDLKTATTRLKELGAEVMKEFIEVPNMGSFTIFTEPTGAIMGLWETSPAMDQTQKAEKAPA